MFFIFETKYNEHRSSGLWENYRLSRRNICKVQRLRGTTFHMGSYKEGFHIYHWRREIFYRFLCVDIVVTLWKCAQGIVISMLFLVFNFALRSKKNHYSSNFVA